MEEPKSFVQVAAEFDGSQSVRQTPMSPPGGPGDPSFQLVFQDSGLSPALSLLQSLSHGPHHTTEFSVLQNTRLEFAPLRASPDFSVVYDKSQIQPQDPHNTSLVSEPGSLSQNPLTATMALAEEGGSSCLSISQHSMSLVDDGNESDPEAVPATATDGQEMLSREDATRTLRPVGRTAREPVDEPTGANSSAASSASDTSVRMTSSLPRESKSTTGGVPRWSTGRREHPPGGSGRPEESRQGPSGERVPPELANISIGSRHTHPDDSSLALRRELLSEAELSRSGCEGGATRVQTKGGSTHTSLPGPATGTSRGRPPGGILAGVLATSGRPLSLRYGGVPGTVARDFWSSGNQLGVDGSYLGLLPQSQSTPGVFDAPARSGAKCPLALRGAARAENSPDTPSSHKVPTLPSLSFTEKVDAWRANQNVAGKPSLFDRLALQGFAGVSPKKRAYDAISDSLNRILSRQVHPDSVPSDTAPDQPQQHEMMTKSFSSLPGQEEEEASGPASPLGPASQSHSSISTVVTSVQPPGDLRPPDDPPLPSPLAALGRFSDLSLETVSPSPSQDEYRHTARMLGASTGPPSSVVSLEVDNYAPYWTSRPLTPLPPPDTRPREFNIEDRIPVYLHNLGIDQSPSSILTPFGPRGPIREPEFSPTDLLTIKGSVGTPAKSDSPHKGEEFSRCSLLSLDSSVSVPLSMDSLGPAALSSAFSPSFSPAVSPNTPTVSPAVSPAVSPTVSPSPDQPPPGDSQNPGVALLHSNTRAHRSLVSGSHAMVSNSAIINRHAGVSHTSVSRASMSQTSVSRTSDSHVGSSRVTVRLSDRFESAEETAAGDRKSLWLQPRASSGARRNAADSPVGANASPTQQPLGVSSSSSSSFMPMSRLHSDDDLLLSLRRRSGAAGFRDSAFTSWSGGGALEDSSSSSPPLWARSSSDSALTSERRSDLGLLPRQPDYPTSQHADRPTRREEGAVSRPPLVAKTARRAEPEVDPEHGVLSDGGTSSSDGSLAARVARLLQSGESSVTMTTSTSSSAPTDQEDTRAREWLHLKVSGQRCESLELDAEDRRRIEEIKRELLLRRPLQSHVSTDTEGSTVSSLGGRPLGPPARPAAHETPPAPPRRDLESRVQEIAAREGVTLPRATAPPTLTSITISTRRRSPSPSPCPSPAPPASPEPLRLTHLRGDTGPPPPAPSPSNGGRGIPTSSSGTTAHGGDGPDGTGSVTGSSSPDAPPDGGGHISRLRLTLSPRRPEHGAHAERTLAQDRAWQRKPPSREGWQLLSIQSEASSSGSTVESTHPGSDDALPPRFGPRVLGTTDPGVARGVSFRHAEGIYSKRLRTAGSTGQPVGHTGASGMHLSGARRDQGTGPLHLLGDSQSEESGGEFRPMDREADPHGSAPPSGLEGMRDFNRPVQSQQTGHSLDQLWLRFSERRGLEEFRPTNDREASLLERLERLSRLIHGGGGGGAVQGTGRGVSTQGPPAATQQDGRTSEVTGGNGDPRLVRAFGSDRVQRNLTPGSSPSLGKLYRTIHKAQAQSPLRYMLPNHRRPSGQDPVRLVDRGVQAGELEIVSHATRRHTRDVGTTFPSPANPNRNPQDLRPLYPQGVSWFIATEDQRSEDRKENRPTEEEWAGPRLKGEGPVRGRGSAWFEAYSRTRPWREPLRQRQVQEERTTGRVQEGHSDPQLDSQPFAKTVSSGLVRLSLQESLALRRPEFVSGSRERMRRLGLQAEDRRLQALFSGDGEQQQSCRGPGPPWRAPHLAGTSRRAVPRKEMVLRSKLIYQKLPEVQRRREEERRQEQYRSYRLNAQLYNK
ncbi:hypothetical protein NHX12_020062, partial [Muraenolepis orangiensis]